MLNQCFWTMATFEGWNVHTSTMFTAILFKAQCLQLFCLLLRFYLRTPKFTVCLIVFRHCRFSFWQKLALLFQQLISKYKWLVGLMTYGLLALTYGALCSNVLLLLDCTEFWPLFPLFGGSFWFYYLWTRPWDMARLLDLPWSSSTPLPSKGKHHHHRVLKLYRRNAPLG